MGGIGRAGAWRALAALALAAAVVPGCDPSLFRKVNGSLFEYSTVGKTRVDFRRVPALYYKKAGPAKETGPTVDVLRFLAKKDADPSYAFLRVDHDLRASFRLEVSVGKFDGSLDLAASPAFAALEVDERDSSPLVYFGVGAQFSGGTGQAFAFMNGEPNLGAVNFAGTDMLDLAIEASGGALRFEARPTGGGKFQTLATTPYLPGEMPLVPNLGANNLAGGSGFSFTNGRLCWNGEFEPIRTPRQVITDDIDCAWEAYWDFCDAVAAGYPGEALLYLEEAEEYLADAADSAEELGDDKATRRLVRDLDRARGKLIRAANDLEADRALRRILGRAATGMRKASSLSTKLRGFKYEL